MRKIFLPIPETQTDARAKDPKALAARRRQRSAYVLRVSLLALSLAAVIGLFWSTGWITLPGAPDAIENKTETPKSVALQPTAVQTEMTGVDQSNMPFKITASKATQNATSEKTVDLEGVTGEFAQSATETLNVTSNKAAYNAKGKSLELEGHVVIRKNDGTTATMEKAAVDVNTRQVRSQSPVKIVMESGEVTADTLEVDNNGEMIKLKGRVRATFGGDNQ